LGDPKVNALNHHQYFMREFFADILAPKKHKAKCY